MAAQLREQGYVDEPWLIAAHSMARSGDRVWVLRQGRGPKGIFGAGRIIGPPTLGPAGNGKIQMMAPGRFEAFVDPDRQLLIDESAVAAVLRPNQIRGPRERLPDRRRPVAGARGAAGKCAQRSRRRRRLDVDGATGDRF